MTSLPAAPLLTRRTRAALALALLAAGIVFPLLPFTPDYWVTLMNTIGLASLVVIGLVLLTGVGGMTSFGQAAFCGFGAYTTALLTTQLAWSPWLTLPVAVALTCGAAFAIGLLTVRLSGHFLPLGTLAWGISLYYLFGNLDFLGRHDGISTVPPLSIGGWDLYSDRAVYFVIWTLVLLTAFATLNLLESRVGRALRSLRGGVVAAEAFGIDTGRAKLVVFVYAAFLAALSGWAFAHVQRAVNPTPFGLNAGIEYLLMAVIGGVGNVWGALAGAAAVVLLKDQLQTILPALFGHSGSYETIIFGLVLVLLLQFARAGLWGFVEKLAPPLPPAPSAGDGPPPEPLARRSLPAKGEPLLAVEAIQRNFGGLMAVKDVTFTVEAGEIVGLIGPNGAGKSTTFNLISGILPPSKGAISFRGQPIGGLRPGQIARLGMARSFQHVKLLPNMTVLENVMLGAHLRGRAGLFAAISRRDRAEERRLRAEAERALARCGLTAFRDTKAGSLALGQSRVVEIARALCLDPLLILLDEPAAGLRHGEKQELAALLSSLRAEGTAVLLVEHDMDFVMNLVDRLVVMDFGQKIAEGNPEQVANDPVVLEAYLGGIA